ncbi:ski oncogene [Platysternon megacephalum]|uniref:Ski oncogene n=1 Tax=Platysternon megacephalum TaxID=55544 RepID=A0A4D9ES42_9SAUR|nr:ski oncogene [Platysternon megacephalum]
MLGLLTDRQHRGNQLVRSRAESKWIEQKVWARFIPGFKEFNSLWECYSVQLSRHSRERNISCRDRQMYMCLSSSVCVVCMMDNESQAPVPGLTVKKDPGGDGWSVKGLRRRMEWVSSGLG